MYKEFNLVVCWLSLEENELISRHIGTLRENEVRMSTPHKRIRGKCLCICLLLTVPLTNKIETHSLGDLY